MKANEILEKYTSGKATLEETNIALKKINAGYFIDPNKNAFTAEELMNAVAGKSPEEANGFGMLDQGVGSFEKVEVKNGKFAHAINTVDAQGNVNEYTLFIIAGKTYQVKGDRLTDVSKDTSAQPTTSLPKKVDLSRKMEFKGQSVIQKTAIGTFEVFYDDDGYAVKSVKQD